MKGDTFQTSRLSLLDLYQRSVRRYALTVIESAAVRRAWREAGKRREAAQHNELVMQRVAIGRLIAEREVQDAWMKVSEEGLRAE